MRVFWVFAASFWLLSPNVWEGRKFWCCSGAYRIFLGLMVRMWASLGLAFAISPIFFLLWVNYAFCEFRQFKSVVD